MFKQRFYLMGGFALLAVAALSSSTNAATLNVAADVPTIVASVEASAPAAADAQAFEIRDVAPVAIKIDLSVDRTIQSARQSIPILKAVYTAPRGGAAVTAVNASKLTI